MSLGKAQGGRDVKELEQPFNQLRTLPELSLIAGHLFGVLLDKDNQTVWHSTETALVYREQDS